MFFFSILRWGHTEGQNQQLVEPVWPSEGRAQLVALTFVQHRVSARCDSRWRRRESMRTARNLVRTRAGACRARAAQHVPPILKERHASWRRADADGGPEQLGPPVSGDRSEPSWINMNRWCLQELPRLLKSLLVVTGIAVAQTWHKTHKTPSDFQVAKTEAPLSFIMDERHADTYKHNTIFSGNP